MSRGNRNWQDAYGSAIMVCNREGVIIYMNEKAEETFAEDGGSALIGRSLTECHKPESWELIRSLIAEGRSNTYTIEKKGKRKLIHQAPWFANGVCSGLVEIAVELPFDMPHRKRD